MSSLWMEVAVVAVIFAVGNILFGHWEVETPKWRRLLKFVLILGVTLALSAGVGRRWAFVFLGLLGIFALIIHGWWLPRQGINGWTAEPKEKYYAMRGWKYPPLILALVAILADRVGAQVPDSLWRAAVARLTPGATVRLHSRDRGRIEGRLVGAGGTTLNLETGATRTEWSISTLDSLWVRRTSTKTGAIIGAISGAVAGGLLGVFANELGCKDQGDPCPEAIPLVGLGGAAAGALLGGVIGALIPKWQRKVPS